LGDPVFSYDPTLIDSYPTIRAGVIRATGLSNGPSPADLTALYRQEQHKRVEQFHQTPIAELASIAAWRRAFSKFGVKPTQYRNAAEALLRRLSKHGDIPGINLLVDLGNLVSIRYALPVAFFDQAAVTGATTVRFSDGSETFTDLGSGESVHPEAGEVIFVDDAGQVSARRWCWRQSAQSATGPTTTSALVTVEGHHGDARADVGAAIADLAELLRTYQRQATLVVGELSAESPSFQPDGD
jgi:DNA/RNA-binding domain of Phe-tRNA-synthetase-like protein